MVDIIANSRDLSANKINVKEFFTILASRIEEDKNKIKELLLELEVFEDDSQTLFKIEMEA